MMAKICSVHLLLLLFVLFNKVSDFLPSYIGLVVVLLEVCEGILEVVDLLIVG